MKNKGFLTCKALVTLYLVITILLPLGILLFQIQPADVRQLVTSAQFKTMVGNSLLTAGIATFLSIVIAFVLAYAIERSRMRGKEVWAVLLTISMLIPSISHGMGLVMLLGENGILRRFLPEGFELYGYTGIIMGSVIYAFPIAFLMFRDSLQHEDYAVYEAAQVLGISKWRCFLRITLPGLKGTFLSAIFAVFTVIFTDYGVPLMTGGKVMTLAVYMYREVVGMMDFSRGAFIGLLLLLPAIIAFLIDIKKENSKAGAGSGQQFLVRKNRLRDIGGYLLCAVFVVVLFLPIFAFVLLSFTYKYPVDMHFSLHNVWRTIETGAGVYLINSLAVAMTTALFGTGLTCFLSYVTARTKKSRLNSFLHLVSMLSLAIPGVVLGLAYVFTFKNMPFYATIYILIMVNSVHFLASPYLLAYNSFQQMNENLEDVAESVGIGHFRMLTAVYLPGMWDTILEMYSFIFVNCMVTISAVSFLATFRTMPVALLIPQLESQSFLEGTAFLSFTILIVNLLEKGLIYLVKRRKHICA